MDTDQPTPKRKRVEPDLDPDRLGRAMEDWVKTCAKRLRDRRIDLKMTQKELAERVGVRQAAISRFEGWDLLPRDSVRAAIAAVLQCEVNDIWQPLPQAEIWARAHRERPPIG